MKKIILSISNFIIISLSAQSVDLDRIKNMLSAYDGELTSGTARSVAMGNAMGALGGDIAAMNSNPAASGIFISNNISFTLGLDNNNTKTNFGQSFSADNSDVYVKNFGGVLVIDTDNNEESDLKSISLGFSAVNQSIDQEHFVGRRESLNFYDSIIVENFIFNGYNELREGKKSLFTANLGANFNNRIYFGTNLNFHSIDIDHSKIYSETGEDGYIYYMEPNGTPYYENSDGFSFSVGAIAKITQNIRLGASYTSPIWWNNVYTEFVYYDDNDVQDETLLYNFDQDRFKGSSKLALSGAIVLNNFAINADYIRHFHSNDHLKDESYYVNENNFIENYIVDTNEMRIGAEYRYKKIKLRAGWGTVSSPMEDVTLANYVYDGNKNIVSSTISDLYFGKKNMYSFGLGYNFGGFYLDFAYQNIIQDYNYVMNGVYIDNDFSNYYSRDILNNVAKVKNKSDNYLLTLGFNF